MSKPGSRKKRITQVEEVDSQRMSRYYSSDKARCLVTFSLPAAAARAAAMVTVAGTFNGWSRDRHPLRRLDNGDFELELELDAGRHHEFRFLVDGTRWENAWNADRYVWNEHAQCDNSVVVT